jgi:periplasmic divalent cation tolerance protein
LGRYDGRLLVLRTTFGDRAQAEAVVAKLVADRLVVCGQVGTDVQSIYCWRGEVTREKEITVTLKIREDRFGACLESLRRLHPYEIPQLVAWPASYVDEAYGRWAWEEGTCG